MKSIRERGTFLNEYKNTVPASLYAGFTMLLMILGSYYFTYSPTVGELSERDSGTEPAAGVFTVLLRSGFTAVCAL